MGITYNSNWCLFSCNSQTVRLFPRSKDGTVRIFLPPFVAARLKPTTEELHRNPGPFEGRSTNWASAAWKQLMSWFQWKMNLIFFRGQVKDRGLRNLPDLWASGTTSWPAPCLPASPTSSTTCGPCSRSSPRRSETCTVSCLTRFLTVAHWLVQTFS